MFTEASGIPNVVCFKNITELRENKTHMTRLKELL